MDEGLAGLCVGRHRAAAHRPEALDDGGLACAVLSQNERQGLEELYLLLLERTEAADAANAELVNGTHMLDLCEISRASVKFKTNSYPN